MASNLIVRARPSIEARLSIRPLVRDVRVIRDLPRVGRVLSVRLKRMPGKRDWHSQMRLTRS